MKKTYLIPQIAVVKLNACQPIMTGSLPKNDQGVDSGDVLAPEMDPDFDEDF